MMLTNNKFERYQQNLPAAAMTTILGSSASSSPSRTCGSMAAGIQSSAARTERESIHSGQFMVSHFEAEEAQDDLLDDSEVKMLDPEDPSLSKPDEPNTCTEVQLFVPRKVALLQQQQGGGGYVNTGVGMVTSHLEIETSLTKLFKCMNLAYSQKLTSPKWNHFKGVRLRWKDKIRLNNVIWRCWHMQFILKRRTPVCQFASPLDVDVHSNPQTVVLEGKYWKRQLAVIKAEYRKWRRHFKLKVSGCLTYDTKSEFDFLEWSPLNDRSLMISDDWTSDTLFSAIDGPFPFPDSREIARGAGIADFIQPSLGPLQPNLEDIDITFSELIQATRLAPVPEEGTDEMLKSVDYNFSSIMCSEQMDSTNIIDEMSTSNNNISSISASDDANMMDLNTPLNAMQYSDIEQQFATRNNQNSATSSASATSAAINNSLMNSVGNNQMMVNQTPIGERVDGLMILSDTTTATANPTSNLVQPKQFCYASGTNLQNSGANTNTNDRQQQQQQNSNDFPGKSVIKGRISKNVQRPFRREPHNYDKAQPTLHQTTIYQQMLAEQQKNQQHQQQQQQQQQSQHQQHQIRHQQHLQPLSNFQQQQQQQMQFVQTQYPQNPAVTSSNLVNKVNYNNANTSYNVDIAHQPSGSNNLLGRQISQQPQQQSQQQQQHQSMLLNIKIEPPNNDVLNMFNLTAANDIYGQNNSSNNSTLISSNAFKPYPNAAVFKKSSSTGTFVNIRGPGSPFAQQDSVQQQQQQQMNASAHGMHSTQSLPMQLGAHTANTHTLLGTQQQQQQPQQQNELQQPSTQLQPKEMFRSNSLPLNVTLQNLETLTTSNARLNNDSSFAVPKYHAKSHKSRTRSNSVHQTIVPTNSISNSSNNNQSLIVTQTIGGNVASGGNNSSFVASSQLQAATSDPMLHSTLAQLLTANNRMAKHQSASTSAISSTSLAPLSTQGTTLTGILPTTIAANSPSNQSTQPMSSSTVNSGLFMSPTQSSSSSSSLVGISSIASSPSTTQDIIHQQHQNQRLHHQQQQQQQQHIPLQALHYQQQQQQQQQQQAQVKSPKKSTSLPANVKGGLIHSPPQSKTMSYPLTSSAQASISNISLSPESYHDQDSPLSPTHSLKFPRDNHRRVGHIHAEQKRRYNIKNGFELLHSLIPQLQQNPNAKLSKAAMLQKGADHIRQLCFERSALKEKMEMFRQERDALNNSLTHLYSILPANGAPVTRQGTENVRQLYEQYVRYRTMNNWKFWILGLILEPLLTSYTASVSSASMEEMRRTAFLWVDQHCSLIDLRPAVSNKLKYLSMKTDILSDPPSTLQSEVSRAVKHSSGQHPNLHGT